MLSWFRKNQDFCSQDLPRVSSALAESDIGVRSSCTNNTSLLQEFHGFVDAFLDFVHAGGPAIPPPKVQCAPAEVCKSWLPPLVLGPQGLELAAIAPAA